MKAPLAGLALVITLTACGSNLDAEPPMSAAEVAAKIGCDRFKPTHDDLFIREGGACFEVNGIDDVDSFSDNANQKLWLDFAKKFGGVYLVGDRWVVSGHSIAALKRAQAKIGGDIQ